MIGGRVLDVTAVVGFSTGQSVYAEASVVLARASALIPRGHERGLDVLFGLPCTVVDPLDTVQARAVGAICEQSGEPCGDLTAAHAVYCAQQRGWPVVSSDPEPLLTLDSSIEIENLP